jgi:hypothetical protein
VVAIKKSDSQNVMQHCLVVGVIVSEEPAKPIFRVVGDGCRRFL